MRTLASDRRPHGRGVEASPAPLGDHLRGDDHGWPCLRVLIKGSSTIKQFGRHGGSRGDRSDAHRCVLVPRSSRCSAAAAWWMPKWLGARTPRRFATIEGEGVARCQRAEGPTSGLEARARTRVSTYETKPFRGGPRMAGQPMQLGMVGLGRMGAGIVRRLMRDGHRVRL